MVEVGINVVNATVMSVYNPDRFGLSSLHQLRGRVGRGGKPGFCFLVTDKKLSGETQTRLKVIERSNDGFEIAEADLKNSGEGDLFGVNQSGTTEQKRFGSIFEHFDIFDQVNRDLPDAFRRRQSRTGGHYRRALSRPKSFIYHLRPKPLYNIYMLGVEVIKSEDENLIGKYRFGNNLIHVGSHQDSDLLLQVKGATPRHLFIEDCR